MTYVRKAPTGMKTGSLEVEPGDEYRQQQSVVCELQLKSSVCPLPCGRGLDRLARGSVFPTRSVNGVRGHRESGVSFVINIKKKKKKKPGSLIFTPLAPLTVEQDF